MNIARSLLIASAIACFIVSNQPQARADAAAGPAKERTITVYSSADPASFDPQAFIAQQRQGYNPNYISQVPGFGVVRETREADLQQGQNELRFTDVAQFIDPTTVSIASLSDPQAVSVLEQNFQFDLASPDKILDRYIDQDVRAVVNAGNSTETVSGRLISKTGNQLVLKTQDGVRILNSPIPQIQLGELPGGLITRPTLVWKLTSKKAGKQNLRLGYQTEGITWRADYNLLLNGNDTAADISAWVSLMNLTGADYKDATLKLIAGDVQRIQPQAHREGAMYKSMVLDAKQEAPGFQEKSFFEYHLYTLPRKTDILQNSTQQITLFPTATGVKVEKVLVYYGQPQAAYWIFSDTPMTDRSYGNQSNKKLDIYLRLKNEKANNMGMPLPKGKVRVYKEDADDHAIEFLGEDVIDHTPKDEQVMVKIGQAFDVVGERTQTNFTVDTSARTMTESFRIELRNHKDSDQQVVIKENLWRWLTWSIVEKSDDYKKIDSRTINFEVKVPANGTKTVTYTVHYKW